MRDGLDETIYYPTPDGNYTINKYKIIRKKHEINEEKP